MVYGSLETGSLSLVLYIGVLGMGQNIWGTQAGTTDRGAKRLLFEIKKGAKRFFREKKRGTNIFFCEKKLGAKTFLLKFLKNQDFILQKEPFLMIKKLSILDQVSRVCPLVYYDT